MSATQEVTIEIRQIISKLLALPEDSLKAETPISSLPNIDSMRTLEIILAIEKKYGIEVPDAVTFSVNTIGEFEQIVQKLIMQHSAEYFTN